MFPGNVPRKRFKYSLRLLIWAKSLSVSGAARKSGIPDAGETDVALRSDCICGCGDLAVALSPKTSNPTARMGERTRSQMGRVRRSLFICLGMFGFWVLGFAAVE